MNIKTVPDWPQIFKALGHSTRYQIVLGLLNKNNCDVSTMQKTLRIPQATLSQHLSVLKNAGVLGFKREGTRMCYHLSNPALIKLLQPSKFSKKGVSVD